ncbi:phage tail tip lysozyme [Enterococcus sp. JNUCC 77]
MSTAVAYMRSLMSKGVTYSMGGSRSGADGTADCSGAVMASLNAAGANAPLTNTDGMFSILPTLGFEEVGEPHQFGDIFIHGQRGASGGAAGHTGIFLDGDAVIHCNYGSNGVSIDSYGAVYAGSGYPPRAYFRSPNQAGGEQGVPGDAASETNTAANMDNGGEIESYSYIGNRLCVSGWHFTSLNNPVNGSDVVTGGGGNSGESYQTNWNDVQSRAQLFIYVCLDLGIPKDTALALAANAFAESSLRPSAAEPNGMGKGYLQWSYASNWGDVPNHMTDTYEDAKYQINFAMSVPGQWMNKSGYITWDQFWKSEATAEHMTEAFLVCWERPKYIVNRWTPFIQAVDINALDYSTSTTKIQTLSENIQTYSSNDGSREVMQIFDAITDELLKTVDVELMERPDIKEKNQSVAGVEWSGIDLCVEFEHTNPFYVNFMRILPSGMTKTLNLSAIFFPHSSSRKNVGRDYSHNKSFKIILTDRNGKQSFINDIIGGFSWTNKPMEIPSCSITIPTYELCKVDGNMDIKIIVFDKMFDGIIKKIDTETGQIDIDHKISEWKFRQIPENYGIKNYSFPEVFSQSPFLYSTFWYINCDEVAQKAEINYVFSKQDHLEALDKACELSPDIYWRVGFKYDRYLEIGAFGEEKNYILSKSGQTKRHINIIGDVNISKEFDDVFNALTVYGEKSDSSQASLTLREAYLDQENGEKIAIDGFPIVILPYTVNNEQKDYYTDITKIASNNSVEYTIIDEFGVNLEQGKIIEQTKSFNDLAPFELDGESVSDEDRAKQSKICLDAGVKLLKTEGRRKEIIEVPVGWLPPDINVMDKIYFDYDNSVVLFENCSRYCRKVYESSELFYINEIETTFDEENLAETNVLKLSKEVYRNV